MKTSDGKYCDIVSIECFGCGKGFVADLRERTATCFCGYKYDVEILKELIGWGDMMVLKTPDTPPEVEGFDDL